MKPSPFSRRAFIQTLAASAISSPLLAATEPGALIAYVGTYTSPLQNMRATQVDLPPGNGRGIHLFEVDRNHRGDETLRTVRNGHQPELPGLQS
jgi:6-phosphogluconolactonase